jgi:cytochrome c-type biogenesis protein CcmH/NrfF
MREYAIEAGDLEGEQLVRALDAYRQGQNARAAGTPCLCIECQTNTDKVLDSEAKRLDYTRRRAAELMANGASWSDVRHVIQQELNSGAAL